MSVIQHKSQRVAVLIDTQNLYHSARNLYGARVNFQNVLESAVGGRHLVRAIAYLITTESQDEAQFFDALIKMGIETKSKDLQIFYGGAKKADWDVGITVDAMTLAKKVDALVLVTGDGDFVPLIEFLKHEGVQVEVASFGRSSSSKLKEVSDAFLDLSEDSSKYILGNNRKMPEGKKLKTVKKTPRNKKNSIVKSKDGGETESNTQSTDVRERKDATGAIVDSKDIH